MFHPGVTGILASMNVTRTLIATELLSYREALAMSLRELRPEVEVFEVEGEALDREVRRLLPDVVICSHATSLVTDHVRYWIELYPYCEPKVTISIFGKQKVVDDIHLTDIASLVDEASSLVRSA